jgi:hypothetical protein
VDAHERVDGIHWVLADEPAGESGVVDHFGGGVDGTEAVEEGGESWGEASTFVLAFERSVERETGRRGRATCMPCLWLQRRCRRLLQGPRAGPA